MTLFPRETCSCPSTGTCYHIIAAKMSLGVSFANEPTKRNLTQLRRNTRKRQEKKSGRKRPRPTDADPEIIGKPFAWQCVVVTHHCIYNYVWFLLSRNCTFTTDETCNPERRPRLRSDDPLSPQSRPDDPLSPQSRTGDPLSPQSRSDDPLSPQSRSDDPLSPQS